MNLYAETMQILKKYNISANKNLGQNFLINEDIVSGIIKEADVQKEDLIIEIGPGLGTLTKELLQYAGKVICVELDERMIYANLVGTKLFEILDKEGKIAKFPSMTEEEIENIKKLTQQNDTTLISGNSEVVTK